MTQELYELSGATTPTAAAPPREVMANRRSTAAGTSNLPISPTPYCLLYKNAGPSSNESTFDRWQFSRSNRMNGIYVALMLGLVASAAAYPYPSKQLRIRQVVVRSAESAPEPEVHDPPSRFPPYTFGKQVIAPEEPEAPEAPAEIVEVPDLDEHKAEEVKEKVEEPFIIKPESNSDGEAVEVEGADEEKKHEEEEEKKEEEKHEEEEKEKEEYKEENEEKEESVKAPKPKEGEHEAYDEDKEKKEEEDSSSSSSEEEGKSGEYEVKPDAEKDAEIDPLVQAAHYDEESDGKAAQVPKAAPAPESAPKPACGNDKELRQRVEAIIAELHEIKELCCKLEEIESKEEKAY